MFLLRTNTILVSRYTLVYEKTNPHFDISRKSRLKIEIKTKMTENLQDHSMRSLCNLYNDVKGQNLDQNNWNNIPLGCHLIELQRGV